MTNNHEGFYLTKHTGKTNQPSVFLALMPGTEKSNEQLKLEKYANLQVQTTHPHTGVKNVFEPLYEIERKGTRIEPAAAEKLWRRHYEHSLKTCGHVWWSGSCGVTKAGFACDVRMKLFEIFLFKEKIELFVLKSRGISNIFFRE